MPLVSIVSHMMCHVSRFSCLSYVSCISLVSICLMSLICLICLSVLCVSYVSCVSCLMYLTCLPYVSRVSFVSCVSVSYVSHLSPICLISLMSLTCLMCYMCLMCLLCLFCLMCLLLLLCFMCIICLMTLVYVSRASRHVSICILLSHACSVFHVHYVPNLSHVSYSVIFIDKLIANVLVDHVNYANNREIISNLNLVFCKCFNFFPGRMCVQLCIELAKRFSRNIIMRLSRGFQLANLFHISRN